MTLKIIFAGTPEFALPSLQSLQCSSHTIVAIYTQPNRQAGRGKQIKKSPIKVFADQHQLPCFQPKNFKRQSTIDEFYGLKADVMIVAAYGLILPKPILQAPDLGCINIHASLLPRWRGASPIQQAILSGDKKTGITLMQMNESLDTGDILSIHEIPIFKTDTFKSLHDKLSHLGAEALIELLPHLETHTVIPKPQDNRLATYAPKINKRDAKINWHESTQVIEHKIKAFNSFPVAYSIFEKKPLRIYQAKAVAQQFIEKAGTILLRKGEPIVVTSNGGLQLMIVQLPGKKQITGRDFVNAYLKKQTQAYLS